MKILSYLWMLAALILAIKFAFTSYNYIYLIATVVCYIASVVEDILDELKSQRKK